MKLQTNDNVYKQWMGRYRPIRYVHATRGWADSSIFQIDKKKAIYIYIYIYI